MASRNPSPPLKHVPFTETDPVDGKQYVTNFWYDWALNLAQIFNAGVTETVPLAKITGGGTDGSLTITRGVVTAVILPT